MDSWWTDCRNLASLWRWLIDHGRAPRRDIDGVSELDAADYMSTPWSWTPEWEEMQSRTADAGDDETP